MNLQQFRKTYGIERVYELAERVGASESYLRAISFNVKRPSIDLAVRLVRETDGEITPEALFPDLFQARNRQ